MKIAQIAPIVERVPPKKYGGTERVVSTLTEELVRRGHDVTLFATRDSITNARLISTEKQSARETCEENYYDRNLKTMAHVGLAYQMQDKFDIIHDHCGISSIALASISRTPVIMTLHGSFDNKNINLFKTLNNPFNPFFVSISNSQRIPLPDLNYIGTTYNGLPMEDYPFSKKNGKYLLFVGRITFEKGVHNVVNVARKLNMPLIIAAKLEKPNLPYFEEYIKPYLSKKIRWIGEVTEKERNLLMSRALCFLHAITWREPFGLTLIEAMATGCPVIAFNSGSIPEIVKNKKTGFVVNNIYEMINAVKNVHKISRTYCRKYALENFSSKLMTNKYENFYRKALYWSEENIIKKNAFSASFLQSKFVD